MRRRSLHIRFIDYGFSSPHQVQPDVNNRYAMQVKSLFGWKTFVRAIGGSPAGIAYGPYSESSKDKLLDWILNEKYNTSINHVDITEHPTIKKY